MIVVEHKQTVDHVMVDKQKQRRRKKVECRALLPGPRRGCLFFGKKIGQIGKNFVFF
jgi:hypothetical protein